MGIDKSIYYAEWLVFELADFDSVTDEYATYPARHLNDGSIKTGWAHITSDGDQQIVFDLNKTDLPSATYAAGCFVVDYETDHSNSGTEKFQLEFSSDGSSWDAAVIDGDFSSGGSPVELWETSGAVTPKRYVRFTIGGLGANIQIAHLFLARKIEIDLSPQLDSHRRKKQFYNARGRGRGPLSGERVTAIVRDGCRQHKRTYIAATDAIYDDLELLYDWTRGSRSLLVVVDYEGAVAGDAWVARLNDTFEAIPIGSGLYKVPIILDEVPYLTDGYFY